MNKKDGCGTGELADKTDCNKDQNTRCGCGNLLAKLTQVGVEIKCRRCKKVTIIPLEKFNGS